jgi:hypothetical protein
MSKKSTRISTDELSTFTEKAIERALKVRQEAVVELNQDELEQVSGGLTNLEPLAIKPKSIVGKIAVVGKIKAPIIVGMVDPLPDNNA